jgi:hypothetical protein
MEKQKSKLKTTGIAKGNFNYQDLEKLIRGENLSVITTN